ncbi:MAG: glutamate-5-semialdehyde dehydrogenase [Eubacteriales bacterium]|nr:glutamate-5-semialdehyde dehydrogenase [Eubacteriales bacterium]
MTTAELLENAAKQKRTVATATEAQRNEALERIADAITENADKIIAANAIDLENARGTISDVMLDRLALNEKRVKAMADAVRDVAKLPDPVGREIEETTRPNGLKITKVSVPIGVLAIIYESRPNVTSDAASLALKSGNVCVLRGGKEAINSNKAIVEALREGLKKAGLPEDAICLVTDTTRNSSTELMTAVGKVDLLIPRGGAGLIRACVENAKVPCIETGTGICHIYIDADADLKKALDIVENAKTSRPSVCNAAEVCLVHEKIAKEFLPLLRERLVTDRKEKGLTPVELRLDEKASKIIPGVGAGEKDFDTEFLDYIMAVGVVKSVDEAIGHIALHSTGHSESIVTENAETAKKFTSETDSAAVYVNASTRFTDGGEFGLGCEIGISTQKLHARGPMGLRELTSYKYVIRGNGQIR